SELCWLPAHCILAPRNTKEVSLILKIVTFTHAKFAVRGGGHNPNPGWASIGSTGLLIDLYLLNTLELSRDKRTISVGSGNRWSDVYRYLNGTGVSAAGGRVPEVGFWFQLSEYNASQTPDLLAALVKYQAAAEFDSKAGMTFSPTQNTTTVGLLYAAPVDKPSVFQSFDPLPVSKHLVPPTTGTEEDMSAAYSSPTTRPTKYDIVAASTHVDLELYQDIYAAFIAASGEFSKVTGGTMQMSLQPLTSRSVVKGREAGGNALGLPIMPINWFTAVVSWTADEHNQLAHETIIRLGRMVEDLAKSRNLSLPQLNPNDATFSQDPLHSFGSGKFAGLEAVSMAYDPGRVFQTLQNGGFLLGDRSH
ncbi:MAG: hypothetical protein Q9224_003926, partial [Gallowayella concinna]